MRLRSGESLESRLVFAVLQSRGRIVEEERETSRAQRGHGAQPANERIGVFVARIPERTSRSDGVYEAYEIIFRRLQQLRESFEVFFAVIFAPGFAFRGVDVTIHPDRTEEPQRLHSISVRPGRAAKSFGDAAPGQ